MLLPLLPLLLLVPTHAATPRALVAQCAEGSCCDCPGTPLCRVLRNYASDAQGSCPANYETDGALDLRLVEQEVLASLDAVFEDAIPPTHHAPLTTPEPASPARRRLSTPAPPLCFPQQRLFWDFYEAYDGNTSATSYANFLDDDVEEAYVATLRLHAPNHPFLCKTLKSCYPPQLVSVQQREEDKETCDDRVNAENMRSTFALLRKETKDAIVAGFASNATLPLPRTFILLLTTMLLDDTLREDEAANVCNSWHETNKLMASALRLLTLRRWDKCLLRNSSSFGCGDHAFHFCLFTGVERHSDREHFLDPTWERLWCPTNDGDTFVRPMEAFRIINTLAGMGSDESPLRWLCDDNLEIPGVRNASLEHWRGIMFESSGMAKERAHQVACNPDENVLETETPYTPPDPCSPNRCIDRGDRTAQCHRRGTYDVPYCNCSTGYFDLLSTCVPEVPKGTCPRESCTDNGDKDAICVVSTTEPNEFRCLCTRHFYARWGTCNKFPCRCTEDGDQDAVCVVGADGAPCKCSTGYVNEHGYCIPVPPYETDDPCRREPGSNPCQKEGDTGAVCTSKGDATSCECSPGHVNKGGTCVPTDPCRPNPCEGAAVCVRKGDAAFFCTTDTVPPYETDEQRRLSPSVSCDQRCSKRNCASVPNAFWLCRSCETDTRCNAKTLCQREKLTVGGGSSNYTYDGHRLGGPHGSVPVSFDSQAIGAWYWPDVYCGNSGYQYHDLWHEQVAECVASTLVDCNEVKFEAFQRGCFQLLLLSLPTKGARR